MRWFALGGDTGQHVASLLAAEGSTATPAWMSSEHNCSPR